MARIAIEGAITGSTRRRVLKALKEAQEREFPALLLRIDSPGGTVGDSQEIYAALLRLREKAVMLSPASEIFLHLVGFMWVLPQTRSCPIQARSQGLLV